MENDEGEVLSTGSIRPRLVYAALAVVTIGAGLAVHFGGRALDPASRDVLGDALWAVMAAWLVGAAAPRLPLWTRAAAALAVCFAVEFNQLYRAPWLVALRRTTAGHIVLGSGFDPRDLAAYAAGVLAAVLLERLAGFVIASRTSSGR